MGGQGIGDSERPSTAGTESCAPPTSAVTPDADPKRASQPWDRRTTERVEVAWSVDCETEDTFLYAAITNISEMGIFVRTDEPLAVGTSVTLRFAPPQVRAEPFVLDGVVQWVNRVRPRQDNPNPGMGIRFVRLTLADRERIVEAIHTIAYLREEPRCHDGGDPHTPAAGATGPRDPQN